MKTKHIFFVFIILLFQISCNGQKKNQKINPIQQKDKIEELKNSFDECKKQKPVECNNFFYKFPKNFEEFIELYGYTDGVGGHPLYKNYEAHIEQYFLPGKSVKLSIFVSKTIDIAQDGIWDADAVNLFQDKLIELILTNTKDVILELNKRDKSKVKSFWEFCFDSPHPKDIENKKIYEKIVLKIKEIDKSMVDVVNKAYNMKVSNENH